MSNYPDWVNQFKQKGTTIKKVGNSFYLYKSTSKRVPGKKYPQPIQTFIGTITPEGVVPSKVRKISTERVRVYEYGFSYALKELLPEKLVKDIKNNEKGNFAFLNIVRHFSHNSYLLRNKVIPSMEELHMSLSAQIKKYERLSGVKIKELLSLSDLYLVETKECDMLSEISSETAIMMKSLGVELYEL